jgi:hypothetical protein
VITDFVLVDSPRPQALYIVETRAKAGDYEVQQ